MTEDIKCVCGSTAKIMKSFIVRIKQTKYYVRCDACGKKGFEKNTPQQAVDVWSKGGFYG